MTKVKVTPEHGVCRINVAIPTLLVEPFRPGDERLEVFVQWFGESECADLEGMQFRFPVPCPPHATQWMGHPELFKVIMIGQVKDWPNKEGVNAVAATIKGSIDSWILFVVSSHFTMEHDSGDGPVCFMVPMTITLADGSCGIIQPKKFCDMSILNDARRAVSKKT